MIPVVLSVIFGITGSLGVAQEKWGPAPCGTPVVIVEHVRPLDVEPHVLGWVHDFKASDCEIHLMDDAAGLTCEIIVHEWGHLMGERHNNNPEDIMYEKQLANFEPCHPTVVERWGFKEWDNDDYMLWYGIPQAGFVLR